MKSRVDLPSDADPSSPALLPTQTPSSPTPPTSWVPGPMRGEKGVQTLRKQVAPRPAHWAGYPLGGGWTEVWSVSGLGVRVSILTFSSRAYNVQAALGSLLACLAP